MILGVERPAVETAGYICEVRLRGLSYPRRGCDVERACPCVSLVAGLCSATLAGGDGGYRAAGSSSSGAGDRSKGPLVGLSGAGAPCVLFGLLVVKLYPYGWLMTSTLRYEEGELRYSIYTSLGGSDLGQVGGGNLSPEWVIFGLGEGIIVSFVSSVPLWFKQ
jgi:hypothetical protein